MIYKQDWKYQRTIRMTKQPKVSERSAFVYNEPQKEITGTE